MGNWPKQVVYTKYLYFYTRQCKHSFLNFPVETNLASMTLTKEEETRKEDMVQRTSRGFKMWLTQSLPQQDPNKSLMEKWRDMKERKKKHGDATALSQNLMRALYMFQAPTQLYAFIVHIVPYVFENPWTIYYMHLLCCFICINACANWLAVILYDPGFRKSKDNPYINISHQADNPPDQFRPLIQESLQNHQTDHVVYDMTSKEALPWEYCELCEMHIPPRAHHCKFCKKCILKRDHHCFMVGNCIGFKNQRYFIVLAFYVAIAGGIGCYFTYKYLTEVWWPEATSWTDWIPLVAFYKWLFWGGVKGHVCLMLVHLYLEFLFGFVGCFYFVSQFAITIDGKTLFEVVKKVPIRNTNSIKRNLKSVFGELWFLNFLFPMTLVLKQRDDGIHWEGLKYDHNANKKWVDDGEIL